MGTDGIETGCRDCTCLGMLCLVLLVELLVGTQVGVVVGIEIRQNLRIFSMASPMDRISTGIVNNKNFLLEGIGFIWVGDLGFLLEFS